ncbi:hypothetical protein ZWY2020_048271 [Hordeum vulgare]|nr:hypothetical protein ZWY2020_048271 [Hordeum vulgare]
MSTATVPSGLRRRRCRERCQTADARNGRDGMAGRATRRRGRPPGRRCRAWLSVAPGQGCKEVPCGWHVDLARAAGPKTPRHGRRGHQQTRAMTSKATLSVGPSRKVATKDVEDGSAVRFGTVGTPPFVAQGHDAAGRSPTGRARTGHSYGRSYASDRCSRLGPPAAR